MQAQLRAVGVDFQRASVEVRGELAFSPAGVTSLLESAAAAGVGGELLVLSTCNRTEFYLAGPPEADLGRRAGLLLGLLRRLRPRARVLDQDCLRYEHGGLDAVGHLFSVAAGLRSQIPGDAQILGQLRRAHALSAAGGCDGPHLRAAVGAAVRTARRVRAETAFGAGPASIGGATLEALRGGAIPLDRLRVLVFGSGQAAADIARHLAKQQLGRRLHCSRHDSRAAALARQTGGEAALWSDRFALLECVDAVVAASGESVDCLAAEPLGARLDRGPLVVVDAGVPRNCGGGIELLPGLAYTGLDRLQQQLVAGLADRRRLIPRCEAIVERELAAWVRRQQQAAVEPFLREWYTAAENLRQQIIGGSDKHSEAGLATRKFMKRLLDGPARRLRQLAGSGEGALDLARQAGWVLSSLQPETETGAAAGRAGGEQGGDTDGRFGSQ